MKMFKLVLLFVLLILLMVLTLQNQAAVKVHFLWMKGELSAVVLLFLTAAGGFLMGLLVPLLIREKQKRKDKMKKEVKKEVKNEVKNGSSDDEKNE